MDEFEVTTTAATTTTTTLAAAVIAATASGIGSNYSTIAIQDHLNLNEQSTNNISEELELKLLNFPSKREDLTTAIPLTVIFALLLVTGCIGNLCTAIVIAKPKNKYMHTATNYYLFSLAMSDFLFLILGLPQEMYTLWQRYPYAFGESFCIIRGYLSEASTYASILTISAFTIERYVAICHPLWAHTMSQLPRAITSIVIIWTISAICAIPPAAELGIVTQKGPLTNKTLEESAQCATKRTIYENMFVVSAIVFFIVPMIIVTVLYILIAIELRRSSRMNSAISKQTSSQLTNQQSVTTNSTHQHNASLSSCKLSSSNHLHSNQLHSHPNPNHHHQHQHHYLHSHHNHKSGHHHHHHHHSHSHHHHNNNNNSNHDHNSRQQQQNNHRQHNSNNNNSSFKDNNSIEEEPSFKVGLSDPCNTCSVNNNNNNSSSNNDTNNVSSLACQVMSAAAAQQQQQQQKLESYQRAKSPSLSLCIVNVDQANKPANEEDSINEQQTKQQHKDPDVRSDDIREGHNLMANIMNQRPSSAIGTERTLSSLTTRATKINNSSRDINNQRQTHNHDIATQLARLKRAHLSLWPLFWSGNTTSNGNGNNNKLQQNNSCCCCCFYSSSCCGCCCCQVSCHLSGANKSNAGSSATKTTAAAPIKTACCLQQSHTQLACLPHPRVTLNAPPASPSAVSLELNRQHSPLSYHESLMQRPATGQEQLLNPRDGGGTLKQRQQQQHHHFQMPHQMSLQHSPSIQSNTSSQTQQAFMSNACQQQQQQQLQHAQMVSGSSRKGSNTTINSNHYNNHHHQHHHQHQMYCHYNNLHSQHNTTSRRSTAASSKKSVVRMLVAVVVSFFICWVPFHAQRLLASYLVKQENRNQLLLDIYLKLTYISGVMYYLSSTINPLLYQLMSAKFRLAFKETFHCSLFRCAMFLRGSNSHLATKSSLKEQTTMNNSHHNHHHHHQQYSRHHHHHHQCPHYHHHHNHCNQNNLNNTSVNQHNCNIQQAVECAGQYTFNWPDSNYCYSPTNHPQLGFNVINRLKSKLNTSLVSLFRLQSAEYGPCSSLTFSQGCICCAAAASTHHQNNQAMPVQFARCASPLATHDNNSLLRRQSQSSSTPLLVGQPQPEQQQQQTKHNNFSANSMLKFIKTSHITKKPNSTNINSNEQQARKRLSSSLEQAEEEENENEKNQFEQVEVGVEDKMGALIRATDDYGAEEAEEALELNARNIILTSGESGNSSGSSPDQQQVSRTASTKQEREQERQSEQDRLLPIRKQHKQKLEKHQSLQSGRRKLNSCSSNGSERSGNGYQNSFRNSINNNNNVSNNKNGKRRRASYHQQSAISTTDDSTTSTTNEQQQQITTTCSNDGHLRQHRCKQQVMKKNSLDNSMIYEDNGGQNQNQTQTTNSINNNDNNNKSSPNSNKLHLSSQNSLCSSSERQLNKKLSVSTTTSALEDCTSFTTTNSQLTSGSNPTLGNFSNPQSEQFSASSAIEEDLPTTILNVVDKLTADQGRELQDSKEDDDEEEEEDVDVDEGNDDDEEDDDESIGDNVEISKLPLLTKSISTNNAAQCHFVVEQSTNRITK